MFLRSIKAELIESAEGKETGRESRRRKSADSCLLLALNRLIYTEPGGVYLKRAAVGESGLHYPPQHKHHLLKLKHFSHVFIVCSN